MNFEHLFAFLVLSHGRRQLLWIEVARHPTAAWLAPADHGGVPLDVDFDLSGARQRSLLRARLYIPGWINGIRDRPISPGSPWQNGIAERLIGTMRRECLDQMLIVGEEHLRRVLSAYAAYYN